MASVAIEGHELVVRMQGWNKVRAMRGTLRVPLSHVTGVRARPKEGYFDDAIVESWRGVGTYSPHKLASGVVHLSDGPSFYDVRDPKRTIAIDVDSEPVRHLVLQIDSEEPETAAARILSAIKRYK